MAHFSSEPCIVSTDSLDVCGGVTSSNLDCELPPASASLVSFLFIWLR